MPDWTAIARCAASWFVACVLTLTSFVVAHAQTDAAQTPTQDRVTADTTAGYARLFFTFTTPTAVTASVADGVLTIQPGRPIEADIETLVTGLGPYVSTGRRDAEGGFRFALVRPMGLHTSIQGNRAVVDLVPNSYEGVPPDLPPPPPPPPPIVEALDIASLPVIRVRIGEYSNFSRLVFDWPSEVPYTAFPGQGRVTLRFESLGQPDFSLLEARLPAWVKSVGWHLDGKSLVVDFETDSESGFHDFRDGNKIAIDILAPRTDASSYQPPVDPDGTRPASLMITPVQPLPQDQSLPGSGVIGGAADAPIAAMPPASGENPDPASTDVGENVVARAEIPGTPLPPRAELVRDGIAFRFPAARGHAVAVFSRGPTIWIVLDDHPELELVTLLSGIGEIVEKAEADHIAGAAILRLVLETPLAVTMTESGLSLDIEFSTTNTELPLPVAFTREGANGLAHLSTKLPGAKRVLTLPDPLAGDTLLVVAGRPGKAMLTPGRFVEFEALPTSAGIVISPRTSDLRATVRDETLTLSRPLGLALASASREGPRPTVQPRETANGPSFLDFANWKKMEGLDVYTAVLTLRSAIAKLPVSTANDARIRLAQYFLAQELAPEALGEIEVLQQADPDLRDDPTFVVMRGAAQYMMGRFADARSTISAPTIESDPHVALWRGLIDTRHGDWSSARRNFQIAERVIHLYPEIWQTRAFLARAEAGLAMADLSTANDALDQLPRMLARPDALRAELYRARLLAAQGHVNEATARLLDLERSDYAPIAVRAKYFRVDLQLAGKKITLEDAIEELERLRFHWRGDDLELQTLSKLGDIYLETRRWREGLEVLKSASINFASSEMAREAQDKMRTAFIELFLNGKADSLPPVQALSIFYDFVELTPIGRDGDEMIRRLSDRLVAVDLLGQAEELLDHQVDQRLEGVARATVATKLATIYLLDHQPREVIRILNATRQTGIPEKLHAERLHLEARALNALGRNDAAIDLLADDDSQEGKSLRADIYWEAGNWALAGARTEDILGERWKSTEPLNETERLHIMRAGIAYSMAEDDVALERVRERYRDKMQSSVDASAFEVLTAQVDRQGLPFRDLARRVASVDDLQAFMVDYRRNGADERAMFDASN